MAGSNFGGSDEGFFSEINITPLVDVVLVLLIIFMITAPVIYQSAIKVQLPKTKTGEGQQKSPFQFSIDKSGDLHLGEETVKDWGSLPERIAKLGAGKDLTQETASISADQTAQHGQVMKLIDLLRQSGITRFALNVESSSPAK
ncbi:MAG: biopolymer transporter ExbD [Bdellovibrionales bacterium]|nr:biopolymer transporter ExbD [Bdellovibrionales bacterium]